MSAETDNMELENTPEPVSTEMEQGLEPVANHDSGLEPVSDGQGENAEQCTGAGTEPLIEVPLIPIIEAAMMAAGKPLTLEHLAGLFDEDKRPSKPELKQAMADLTEMCAGRGFELKEIASGWRFQVRQELAPWVGRLWEEKPQRYTRALLETLALIAYRQPITRGEIEDIRGVSVSTNIMRTLQEREWVRVVGHRDVPGRPAMYATTRQFLDYFNLCNLDELPPLSDLRDLDEMAKKLESGMGQQELAVDGNGNPVTPADGEGISPDSGEGGRGSESAGEIEWSASRLVSVEEAQAFQEEGDENIEKLFSELDDMESGLTLTYTDYTPPHTEEGNKDRSSGGSSEIVATVDVEIETSTGAGEGQDGQNDNSPSDDELDSDI